ncbi:phosphatase PAP2 family protein [Actinoallomurus purpureus]|uniref:phosphatase PAP2 family protein n=1 Tax=Actinoallomurus purpureus TaxID=478114 RepID=UPI0025B1735F|nr:phosphatase PAP2 family protein [Actinoallomurus purpureus]
MAFGDRQDFVDGGGDHAAKGNDASGRSDHGPRCGRARWAAAAYPVATTSVVVLTANHYWLDGIVGAVVVIVSVALSGHAERIVSRRGAQGT